MDQAQLLYAVEIASSSDISLRQQANDFLRGFLANADQHWPVSTFSSIILSFIELKPSRGSAHDAKESRYSFLGAAGRW